MSTNTMQEEDIEKFIHEYINHQVDIPSKGSSQPRQVENIDVIYFETGNDHPQVN